MLDLRVVFAAVATAAMLGACAGRAGSSGNGTTMLLPPIGNDIAVTAILPKDTVGEELPSEGLGSYKSAYWGATLGGFTQTQYSQALGFPPGTKITLRNLSKSIPHTLDVVAKIPGPPAKFPSHPNLPTSAHGNGILGLGYASGVINPGKSVTIVLSNAGTYLIGCAFHYAQGMRDAIVIEPGSGPGKQATPPPAASPSPSGHPTPSYQPSYAPTYAP